MKKLGIGLLILMGMVLIAVAYFLLSIKIDTPEISQEQIDAVQVNRVDDHLYTTSNGGWLRKNQYGFWEMYIAGGPVDRGAAFGKMTQHLMAEKEAAFINEIKKKIPSENYLKFLKYFVGWFNRDLDTYIPKEIKQEIYAGSMYMPDEYDYIGPKYYRALNYHAAHDIGHALQNMNLVGCTAFATWGQSTPDNQLLIGRNFDFYFGEAFSEDKILAFVHPDEGYKFASVTWAGFSGVVSGMNEKGLTVTLNSAKSDIPSKAKTPVSVTGRMILQYASNIDEAMDIATSYESFVAESFLIGSHADGKAALIEKSQDTTVLYSVTGNEMVITNHYQSEALKDTPLNQEYMAEKVSQYRFNRVQQLLDQADTLNPEYFARLLRDQRGLDSTFIGLGNERAVNQLLAHHSVIFKPADALLWLSAPPYQLGDYVAYDLNQVFKIDHHAIRTAQPYVDSLTIPADPFLHNSGYSQYRQFADIRDQIQQFLFTGDISLKLTDQEVEQFIASNRESYLPYYYLGDYFIKLNRCDKAIPYLKEGLKKVVARTSERTHMEEALSECRSATAP